MTHCKNSLKKMLPKTYLRKQVAHEIYVALIHFRSLSPVVNDYVYNDGTTKVLMSLTGTLPIFFKDVRYNIPVCVWLEESYPQSAPICYVRPTSEMMILQGHYVSSNGEVLLPYLQDWKQGQCDLISLLQVMTATFGDLPPICMQPPPQPEQASCWLQFHRQTQVLHKADGRLYLSLCTEDGQHVVQENETNC
ncbi:tumor susceptibility gene 101 protein-like [Entelurus aequoreus]|uniref:tumor susceptibility gene 101 protein n=1 Tax=Entelurus aequoreus TaxID=161455 RepID=UPI002B1D80C1|nr:tumor susceptibility gene 101 protein [Entelurus aequoreus]XP_061891172.1 tumor susceptibility gene 101 protein-like [Entelurus aequoreus]